jgi:dTDP-glucose 4,6-dehydratase
MPVLTTNCSNNYGPLQFPEKLIPLMILNALSGKPLPVYGDGLNVRDWLYVGTTAPRSGAVLEAGVPGEVYNVGGKSEMRNIDVVKMYLRHPRRTGREWFRAPAAREADHVREGSSRPRPAIRDRHDKIERELGWTPDVAFDRGHPPHGAVVPRQCGVGVDGVTSGEYRKWLDTNYAARAAGA